MQPPNRQQRLAALRDVIADIERKPALLDPVQRLGGAEPDDFPALPGGLVQEIFADDIRTGGASLGFALAQAKHLVNPRRPAIFYLSLAGDAQKQGLPYGPGLSWVGVDPARLVLVQAANMAELLWAAEEVIACRAVAAMVAEVRGEPKLLNFTASRRLSLRAASSKVSLFLLRYGHGRASSAGHLRWHLRPERSGRLAYDERAPGAPRWLVQLEKGRIAGNRTQWVLEWTKNGFATVSQPAARPGRPTAPIYGSVSAVLGHRLSQAG